MLFRTVLLRRRLAVGLLALALTACATAEATPALVAPATAGSVSGGPATAAPIHARPARHPAMAIVDRMDIAPDEVTPDVVGTRAIAAGEALRAVGVGAQLIALSEDDIVGAQYPEAGAPLPADGLVLVWLGTPPAPPPPVEVVAAPAEAGSAATADSPGSLGSDPAGASAVLQDAAPSSAGSGDASGMAVGPAVPAPGPSVAVGTPPSAAATASSPVTPTPPRSNIRSMAPAAPGTVLEGRASWYGPGFAGRTTACGAAFDPNQLTLATRELRCGTRVLVTGPSGAAVEATVTDWGPAEWTDRRFDLSAATFAAVHHPGAGVIGVRIEVLGG